MSFLDPLKRHGILVSLFLLCCGFAVFNPVFLAPRNLLNILVQSTPIALVAVGMTFVILIGAIDLSVGSILALSGIVFALATRSGWPMVPAVIAGLLAGTICGILNGVLVARAR